jgi:hypothetical protein
MRYEQVNNNVLKILFSIPRMNTVLVEISNRIQSDEFLYLSQWLTVACLHIKM